MKKYLLLIAIVSLCVTSYSDDYEEITNTQEAIEGEIVLKKEISSTPGNLMTIIRKKKIKIKS